MGTLQTNTTMQAFIVAALVAVAAHPAGYAAPDLAEPPVYTYQYGVQDDCSGNNFQQTESRDGYSTSGSYTVALPDGRVQTVNYVDNGDGIVQDVSYSGVPQYGPTVVAAHPVAHAVAHPALIAHPIAHHAVAHPVAIAHPIAHHALAHPVAVAHPALGHAIGHPIFHG